MPAKSKSTAPAAPEKEPIIDVETVPEEVPSNVVPFDHSTLDVLDEHRPAEPAYRQWPEQSETTSLMIKFDDHDLAEIAKLMGSIVTRRENIRTEKKNTAARLQAAIDDLDADLSGHAAALEAGGELRRVECRWNFERAGRDEATGDLVFHPEMKTLVREDTGEVVRIVKITDEERQMDLTLEAEEPDQTEPEFTEDDRGNVVDFYNRDGEAAGRIDREAGPEGNRVEFVDICGGEALVAWLKANDYGHVFPAEEAGPDATENGVPESETED